MTKNQNKMTRSRNRCKVAVASAGLSLLAEAAKTKEFNPRDNLANSDVGVPNQLKSSRPTREKNLPLRFRDSQPETDKPMSKLIKLSRESLRKKSSGEFQGKSTASSASTCKFQAPTKRKSSSEPSHEASNGKSRYRSQRKSPPETLVKPPKQNCCSTNTKPQSKAADTSVQSQASVEAETSYRRLVDGEGLRQPHDKPSISTADRKIRAGIVDNMGYELYKHKLTLGSNRKEQYGADRAFFEQRRHFYGDWLNLKAVKSAAKRYKKKHDVTTAEVSTQPASDSISPGNSNQPPSSVGPSESSVAADVSVEESITSDVVGDHPIVPVEASLPYQAPAVADAEEELLPSAPTINLGGRLKGSTNAAKKDLKRREQLAKDRMAEKLKAARDSMAPGKRLKAGLLDQIMADAVVEFGLDDKPFNVSKQTISQQVMHDSLIVTKRGPKTPMEGVESHILAFAIMKQEAGQPIKIKEVLELGNSLIKGSAVQNEVRKFQKSINKTQTGILSRGWVRGFFSRHQEALSQAK